MEQISIAKVNEELVNLKKEVAEIKVMVENQCLKEELGAWERAGDEDLVNFEKGI